MNICGCLVHTMPERTDAVRAVLSDTPGVDIHAATEDGRLVVVVEDIGPRLASETLMAMHQVPGVISITLTYHHFEDLAASCAESSPHASTTSGGQPHDHL